MKKCLFILFIGFVFMLPGCNSITKPEILTSKDIDDNIMLEINDLDMKIFSALKLNNYAEISEFLSEDIKKELGWQLKTEILPRISANILDKSYSISKDYYAKSLLAPYAISVSEGDGDWKYSLLFTGATRETYISTLKLSNNQTTFLLTLSYGKYDNKWKLNMIQVGQHSFQNKTAPTLYHVARKLEQQGDLLDATTIMALATTCARPAGKHFRYAIDSQMITYMNYLKSRTDKKYPMPYALSNIPTQPRLYNYQSKLTEDGTCLIVNYISQIKLTDTVALKTEFQEIRKTLAGVFPGIDKNNDMFVFNAINDFPKDANDVVAYHTFIFKKDEF